MELRSPENQPNPNVEGMLDRLGECERELGFGEFPVTLRVGDKEETITSERFRAGILEEDDEEARDLLKDAYRGAAEAYVESKVGKEHLRAQIGLLVHFAVLEYRLGRAGKCAEALRGSDEKPDSGASAYAYYAGLDDLESFLEVIAEDIERMQPQHD